MLKTLFFSLFLYAQCASAQAPMKFNFQGVARNAAGNVLPAQNVRLQISILDASVIGASQYTETHTAQTSNLGLFTLQIGGGTVQNGTMSGVTWGSADKFLKIEMDATGGTNYQIISTTQLLSVPYSMYAKEAENVKKEVSKIQTFIYTN
jgi:hypothetical protein